MITKQMIAKLPKNKQIELFNRINKINDNLDFFPLTLAVIKLSIYTFAFSLLVIPLWKLAYPTLIINIVTLFGVITAVLLKLIPLVILGELIGYLFLFLKMEKIKSEYFTKRIEVKK